MTDETTTADGADEETVTLTLEFEIDLTNDDVHRPAWERVLARAPDRDTARETIASRCEFAKDPRTAIYEQSRLIEQQQAEMAQQMSAQPPAQSRPDPEEADVGDD